MKKLFFLLLTFLMMLLTSSKLKAQVDITDSLALVDLYYSTGGENWTNNTNWLTSEPVSTWYGIAVVDGYVTEINLGDTLAGNNIVNFGNNLIGTLPNSIGNFSNLRRLAIDNMGYTGGIDTIPASIGNLSKLTYLSLNNNFLNGVIPNTIGNLTQLTWLNLGSNQLSGDIPSSIGNLSNLVSMWLWYNKLSGTIPSSLGNILPLFELDLNDNQLTGPIPTSILNKVNLYNFYLYNNNFTFNGLESLANKNLYASYAPQAPIILKNDKNVLYVSVGGTSSNNTFYWYKDDSLIATKVGDSTFTYTSSGKYHVNIANNIAKQLTLISTIFTTPAINSFTPKGICDGTSATVNIYGTKFTGVTSVSFGGTEASTFNVNSSGSIIATVPNSVKTGTIKITTSTGTITSNDNFTIGSSYTAYAYIANYGSNSVSVINAETNLITATVAVGSRPQGVSVSPDGTKVYITNSGSNTVSVINTTTNKVVATIPVGIEPIGISVSPDGTKAYVTNLRDGTVSVINTATNRVTSTVSVYNILGNLTVGVSVSPDGTKVYVCDYESFSLSVINASTNVLSSFIGGVGNFPQGVVVSPDGTKVYVANSGFPNGTVSVINTETNLITATIYISNDTRWISISPDGSRVYVTSAENNNVSIINTSTNQVIARVAVGSSPAGVSVSPDGSKLYVTNAGSNTISVINTANNIILATLTVGTNPISYGNFIANVPTTCVPMSNLWTGATSTDWFNAGNWTVGVPSNTIDAILPATPANQPIIGSGTAIAGSLVIESGATLTNNGTLNVYGNFADTGSFVSGAGSTVVLLGASGTISGTDTFANLDIQGNYTVGASASDKIYVTEKLTKTSGTLATSDKLTLISNAAGTALIKENGGALTGKIYVQHYASGNFGYHHFSSPVSDATVNSWSNAFPIFGPDGAPSWLSNWGSLQYYDEVNNTTSLLDSSYYNYTALSNSLTPGQGYTAWLNSLPTLNTFGTPNNGSINIPVTHSTGTNDPKGWNFIGNPYPSPISWTALKALNPSLFGDASCYLWKASGTGTNGTWTAYDGTVGVNGAGDVINSSLGFFVYVNNSGTLNFDNSVRTYSYTSPEIFGAKSNTNALRLSIKDAAANTNDEAVAYTSYKAGFSRKMAQPAGATNATIAFDVKGAKAAINVLTAIDGKTELPISILTPKAGTYTLNLSTKNIDLPVYLKDAVTGTYTDLSVAATITTSSKETVGRYSLVFKQSTVDRLPLTVYPNPAKSSVVVKGSHIASVQVVDNIGRVVKTVSLKDAMNPILSVGGLQAGVYHLRVQTTDGKVSNVGMIVN